MQIAIIADTHLPKGARRLPDACVGRLRAADMIIHAGDFSRLSVLEQIRSYGTLVAVRGNVDDHEVRDALPDVNEVQLIESTPAAFRSSTPVAPPNDGARRTTRWASAASGAASWPSS